MTSVGTKIQHLLHPVVGQIWCLHRVVEVRSKYRSNRELEITPQYLEQLITERQHEGYRFVTIDALLDSRQSRHGGRRINISFDDGFRDVYTHAFPILKRHGIPFTLYLTTGFADRTADVWWMTMEQKGYSEEEFEHTMARIYSASDGLPADAMHAITGIDRNWAEIDTDLIQWQEVAELVASGLCTVGTHGVSHAPLVHLDTTALQNELIVSKRAVENQIGVEVRHMSYPHSMVSAAVQAAVAQAGYRTATLGYGGRIRRGADPLSLPRVYITQAE